MRVVGAGAPLHSEEDVKVKSLLPLLEGLGYDRETMGFEVAVEVHEGRRKKTIFADVVVYATKNKSAPLLLCETKGPTVPLDRHVREQAISYARLLPEIAPLTLITNGSNVQVYYTLDKTRIPELPSRRDLDHDITGYVIPKATRGGTSTACQA